MKDNSDIFKIENNTLTFNKEEARLIDEYKAIIIRDKGSEGDHDGRKKFVAFKELMYIHLVNHPASIYRDLPDELRKKSAKTQVGLPKDWKEDDLIRAATDRFIKDLKCTSLYYSFVNASRGLYSIGEDLNYFNNRRTKLRKHLESLETLLDHEKDKEQKAELTEEIDRKITELQRLSNNILNLSTTLPDAFENLKKLKKQLADEEGSGSEIRGGGTVGRREK